MGVFSEVSARDPVFYRWHGHMENLMQKFRDERLPAYKKEDFVLSGEVAFESVEVWMERKPNKQNLLLTHWENATLPHRDDYVIEYKRINHYDFKFLLKMRNPNRVEKKVIIRLWLVPTNRTCSTARYHPTTGTYNPKEAIALDRFVYKLTGRANEVIERRSTQSALTMKEAGLTLDMMAENVKSNNAYLTWCGLPHNLFLPRSLPVKAGGSQYELIAIATDVEPNVNEGSDGIEHMMCGHKDPYVPLDAKPFGFPFDRKIDFDIHGKDNTFGSVTSSVVQIIFLAGIMPDEMIGSPIFTKPSNTKPASGASSLQDLLSELTTNQAGRNNGVCKTRVMMKQVRHQKSGDMYKVYWCRKGSGEMRI